MFRNLLNTFANCFKIPELKSRILAIAKRKGFAVPESDK